MEFIQLGDQPGSGIPESDAYCFGKKSSFTYPNGVPQYIFREHRNSNGNRGGWKVNNARKTQFKLILTF